MIKHPSKMRVPIDQIAATKVALAKGYDEGDKGFLTDAEIGRLYADAEPNSPSVSPQTLSEALDFLGVETARAPYSLSQPDDYLNWNAAATWRGHFHIAGVGAGHAKTGRRTDGTTEYFVINLVLDLFGTDFLIDNLEDAHIFIGAKGTAAGADALWPTFVARAKVFYNVRGYHGSTIYPNQLQLAVGLSYVAARAGTSGGVSFYANVVLHGQTYWINLDGRPFANFDVPASDLAAAGSP